MEKIDRRAVLDAIPTNWCDPILTGPTQVPPTGQGGNYTPRDLELVLVKVRERLLSLPTVE